MIDADLRRLLADRTDVSHRPSDEVSARIEARLESYVDVAAVAPIETGDTDVVALVPRRQTPAGGRPRRVLPAVLVAAVLLVVAIFAVDIGGGEQDRGLAGNGEDNGVVDDAAPVLVVREGTSWTYAADVILGEETSTGVGVTMRARDVTNSAGATTADVRVRAELLGRAAQTDGALVVDGDTVLFPAELLDPTTDLGCASGLLFDASDGDLAVDLGEVACDGLRVSDATVGARAVIEVPALVAAVDAVPVDIAWQPSDGDERRTTLWFRRTVGIVRIDVDAPVIVGDGEARSLLLVHRNP